MRSIRIVAILVAASFSAPAWAFASTSSKATTAPAEKKEPEKKAPSQAHGVQSSICSRCNPKLAPVYKSKGDWCSEHDRAESQCAICNPELKKKGVKP